MRGGSSDYGTFTIDYRGSNHVPRLLEGGGRWRDWKEVLFLKSQQCVKKV